MLKKIWYFQQKTLPLASNVKFCNLIQIINTKNKAYAKQEN